MWALFDLESVFLKTEFFVNITGGVFHKNKHKPAFLSSGTTGRSGNGAPASLCGGIRGGRLGKGGSPSRVSQPTVCTHISCMVRGYLYVEGACQSAARASAESQ